MRGLLSITDLLNLARSLSMNSLALTDVNGIWGLIHFIQQCRYQDIKPIAGANIITPNQEALILVESQCGYENLCKILSSFHNNVNQNLASVLDGYTNGLFFMSHDKKVLQELNCFVPKTHLFIELRPGVSERYVKELSSHLKLEMVATGDVYFKQKNNHRIHKILRAIDCNTTLGNLSPSECKSDGHWFRNEREMVELFPNSLEALNNSQYLADRCKTDWPFINTIFPGLNLKDTYIANHNLKKKVYEGAKKRYGKINDQVHLRIDKELNIITQKGFAPYFLVVEDIVAKTQSTIGRGSAAASIVSYCLFITQVDPIKYGLHFARFIHPEREDMPDIDIDFPWDERDEILDYIFKKYGTQRTAMVANQVFMKSRSSVREVGKVYGLSNEEINNITKSINRYTSSHDVYKVDDGNQRSTGKYLDKDVSSILYDSNQIVGAFRYPSVHPGGVIIVPDEICKYVPVLTAPKGVQIVEWEKDQVEDAGLLKIDILGNRSLSVVRDSIRNINLNYGNNSLRNKYLDYHTIQPVGDKKTQILMNSGKTMGVFYIESPATRQLLAKTSIVDFEHVVIYSSIIRPAANKYTNLMLSRIHGEHWAIPHPSLTFLRETYGIMVYKEQVSMAVMTMAGLRYKEAEQLRKAMSRNSMSHLISSWKKKFTLGARRRGYSHQIIAHVWDMIASFVGYSFCKPHSASYTMLSFTCAYLKAHFPAEFLAAVISNQGGYYSSYAYMSEAKRFGIKILLPDINESHYEWRGAHNEIQMGFMSIKGIKRKAINEVLGARKTANFDSLDDFLLRVNLDLSDAMALTNAGCFEKIAPQSSHQKIAYQVAGFYLQNQSRSPITNSPLDQKLTARDRHRLEIDVFGFPVSAHPLSRYRSIMNSRIKYAKDIPEFFGQSIYLMGVYITSKATTTRYSDHMDFLTLEDETDIYECILFPSVYRQFGNLLNWERLFIIRGKVEKSFGVHNIIIEKIGSLQKISREKLSAP